MLARYGIDYKSVALNSADFAKGGCGGKVRKALRVRTGWVSFPPNFIGGEFVGGCADLFDACKTGDLANPMNRHTSHFDPR